MEACLHLLAQVVIVTQRTPAPAYNVVAVSRDHAGLQQGGQLTRPHRFTAPRLIHLSEPPLMLRSFLRSVSRGLIYINTPGRIFLDELFIEYEQVTTWEARFLFQQMGGKLLYIINRRLHWMAQWIGAQVAGTTVWLTSNSQLEGTIGRVADTVHAESFITRRNHLNFLWIITSLTYQVKSIQYILYYILFSSKEPLLWFASCPMQDLNRSISRLIMENLKPTP